MSIIADALKKAQRKGGSSVAPPPPFHLKKEEGAPKGIPAPPKPPSGEPTARKAPTATGAPRAVPVAVAKKGKEKAARRWPIHIPIMFSIILGFFAALILFVNKVYIPGIQRSQISGSAPTSVPATWIAGQESSAAGEEEDRAAAGAAQETTEDAAPEKAGNIVEGTAFVSAETGAEPAQKPPSTEDLGSTAGIPAGVQVPGTPTDGLLPPQGRSLAEPLVPSSTSVGIVQKDRDKEKILREDIYHFNMAVYFQRRNDIQSALLEYAKVIELSPYNAEVYSNMGALYNQIGEYEKAVTVLHKALIIDPSYSKAHNNMGLAYYEGGNLEQAQACLARAIELAPADLASYNNLGLVYKKMNEPDKAEETFSRALAIKPDYAAAHYNLALLYEETGRLEEARRHYNAFIDGGGGSPELNFKVQRRLQRLIQSKPGSSPDF